MLASLVGDKTYKECHERAKILKLKSGNTETAKEISNELMSKQARSTKKLLVRHALEWLITSLCKKESEGRVSFSRIKQMCEYVKDIQTEYAEYVTCKEDLILFGHEQDMADIVNNNDKCQMTVVPVTQEEFQMVQNQQFLTFLNAFGISKGSNPRGCL